MTTRYLLKTPLIFLLLTHHEHGSSFFRAVLSILHENPLSNDNVGADILIQDHESTEWGRFIYLDPMEQPLDEQIWYDILTNHVNDVVHFWRQFGLNRECLVGDLQHLSSETSEQDSKKDVPLLVFKNKFPVLFEGLEAVFGMMMSNSRLCEQMHGMMRFGLSSAIGMDQADTQQMYATGPDYEMRQEWQDTAMEAIPKPPTKSTGG